MNNLPPPSSLSSTSLPIGSTNASCNGKECHRCRYFRGIFYDCRNWGYIFSISERVIYWNLNFNFCKLLSTTKLKWFMKISDHVIWCNIELVPVIGSNYIYRYIPLRYKSAHNNFELYSQAKFFYTIRSCTNKSGWIQLEWSWITISWLTIYTNN